MRTLASYMSEYTESHQNHTNVMIHKICVPAIMFSLLGIIKAIPVPATWPLWLDWSLIFIIGSLIYYALFKNVRVFVTMVIMVVPMLVVLELLRPRFFILSVAIFVVAWIGQFIGHKIEGKKPSFFKDLLFLLIGPIWTMNKLTAKMGIDL
ncbi:MAG: DUF962 domain-containing protein, partial [Bdellovibrionales bacterium]|nr:DUF962 domain-containing protein [Bdellovibrionales bacterium]